MILFGFHSPKISKKHATRHQWTVVDLIISTSALIYTFGLMSVSNFYKFNNRTGW